MSFDTSTTGNSYRQQTAEIISRLDVAAECRRFGLRLTGHVSSRGWLECHAIGRDDCNPSAGVNIETGIYKDFAGGKAVTFFDLAAMLGAFPNWRTARQMYAHQTGVILGHDDLQEPPVPDEMPGYSAGVKHARSRHGKPSPAPCSCGAVFCDGQHQYTCSFGAWLRSKSSGLLYYHHLPCDTWRCRSCRKQRLLPQWRDHVTSIFRELPPKTIVSITERCPQGAKCRTYIWRHVITVARWSAVYRSIKRYAETTDLPAHYLRIALRNIGDHPSVGATHYIIYTPHPVFVEGAETSRLTPFQAADRARNDICAIDVYRRPISTSRSWALPPPDKSNCEVIAKSGRFDAESAQRAAVELRTRAEHFVSRDATRGPLETVRFPDVGAWSHEKILELIDRAEGGSTNYSVMPGRQREDNCDTRPATGLQTTIIVGRESIVLRC